MEAILKLVELGYPPAIVVTILCFIFYLKFYNNIKEKRAKFIIGIIAFIVIPLSTYCLTFKPKNSNKKITKFACERVQFSHGAISKTLQGTINKKKEKCYKLRINAGQKLIVKINRNFDIRVIAPGGEVIAPEFISKGKWIGEVPVSGDYLIIVKGKGIYTIKIIIPRKNPTNRSS